MRTRSICPHRSLGNFSSEFHHRFAQRGEDNRRQGIGLRNTAVQVIDELTRIGEWLADLEPKPLVDRAVADADSKTEAAIGQFVDERGALGIIEWMARVEIDDTGAERNLTGDLRERGAPGHVINDT